MLSVRNDWFLQSIQYQDNTNKTSTSMCWQDIAVCIEEFTWLSASYKIHNEHFVLNLSHAFSTKFNHIVIGWKPIQIKTFWLYISVESPYPMLGLFAKSD